MWWGRMGSWKWTIPSSTICTGYESMQEVPVIAPNMLRGPKRRLTTTGINFRPMPSMLVVLSMGSIVSVVTLHGQQNLL